MVLSPSRELAMQTFKFAKELNKYLTLRMAVVVGGDTLEAQFDQLATNPDILIATPGRLMHHLQVRTHLPLASPDEVDSTTCVDVPCLVRGEPACHLSVDLPTEPVANTHGVHGAGWRAGGRRSRASGCRRCRCASCPPAPLGRFRVASGLSGRTHMDLHHQKT